MTWALDHVFFATSEPGDVERELAELGFRFTARRRHAGQGTTNACAVFENAFFELLWSVDSSEIRSELVRPLGLDERVRWRETGACPVGLCFRPVDRQYRHEPWPFETWGYAPPYTTGGAAIPIVTPPGHHSEPLVFISLQQRKAAAGVPHGGKIRVLTHVSLGGCMNSTAMSEGVEWFLERSYFSVTEASDPSLRLEFDPLAKAILHRLAAAPIAISW